MKNYKQLIIARKDLNMSPGKLAAQVSHGSMAWLTTMIKEKAYKYDETFYWTTTTPEIYKHPDLREYAIEAYKRGEDHFHCKPENPDADPNTFQHLVLCEPEPFYRANLDIDGDIYEGWIEGSFTKVVCEARNRNQLMKAATIAEELGLRPEVDFFFIRDNCLTELEPEEVDENGIGRTLTVVGFRPLPADVCEKISRKFQLYK